MAHRIMGVDLGSWSVKVAVATAGLRSTTIVDVFEAPLGPAGDEPADERALRTLEALVRQHGLEHDIPHYTMPGDALSLRVLDFGFTGVKRTELAAAVGTELEGTLPHDLDDIVYDFDVVPKDAASAGGAGAGGEAGEGAGADDVTAVPGAGARSAPGTRVLAVATTRERVRRLLELGQARGLEPRSLIATPTSFARLCDRVPGLAAEPLLVLDFGHARSDVLVVAKGRPVYARTLSRGGRHVTQAIARAWNLPWEQAEQAKHADGFIASAREPAQSQAWERISGVINAELAPLGRELRQTLLACRTQTGVVPRRVLLCGGGARLRGMASWVSEQVDLPVVTANELASDLVGPTLAQRGLSVDAALPALGAAVEAATGRPSFDLRKGEFAYRADFSFIRQRAGFLAGLALTVVAFAAGNAYAALYKLRAEEKMLDERLSAATTEVFGAPATAEEVEEKLAPKKEESPLPKLTAFDQLVEISRRVPPRDKIKLELGEIDIKKDKITIRATADSSASIDEVEKQLKEIDCFEEVQRGKVQSGTADEKQFSLTITSKCM